MIDESCEVPRPDLDPGFNPCRKQVVQDGDLQAYAHMYDVMSERQDREADVEMLTEELEGKRDKIDLNSSPFTSSENKRIYVQSTTGNEGWMWEVNSINHNTIGPGVIPSTEAVVNYVKQNIPNPLPVSMGGTGTKTITNYQGMGDNDAIPLYSTENGFNRFIVGSTLKNYIKPATQSEITAAFTAHTTDTVAANDLLPTGAAVASYVDGHAGGPVGKVFEITPTITAGDADMSLIESVGIMCAVIGYADNTDSRDYYIRVMPNPLGQITVTISDIVNRSKKTVYVRVDFSEILSALGESVATYNVNEYGLVRCMVDLVNGALELTSNRGENYVKDEIISMGTITNATTNIVKFEMVNSVTSTKANQKYFLLPITYGVIHLHCNK